MNLDLIVLKMENWDRWLAKRDLDSESKRELKKMKRESEQEIIEVDEIIQALGERILSGE